MIAATDLIGKLNDWLSASADIRQILRGPIFLDRSIEDVDGKNNPESGYATSNAKMESQQRTSNALLQLWDYKLTVYLMAADDEYQSLQRAIINRMNAITPNLAFGPQSEHRIVGTNKVVVDQAIATDEKQAMDVATINLSWQVYVSGLQ